MTFKGWQKTSLIEYPGKVASVLFTGGCNFRCPYCYNPELVLRPESLPDLGAPEVLSYLRENRELYQAVVVSGGEPTLHPRLPEFLARVKQLGLLVGLETNGSNPRLLEDLIASRGLDFIGLDVKAPLLWESYRRAAGIKDKGLLEAVRESVALLKSGGVEAELRTTVVPGLHAEGDILCLAGQIAGAKRFAVQQFLPGKTLRAEFSALRPYPPATLADWYERIRGLFPSCELRNL